MLPNFLIIGAQKAGSSWLGEMLNHHPDVFVYRGGELHFFNKHFDRGPGWYESHFGDWSEERAVGEKTPQYLSHPFAAERIKSTLGEKVRLIVSLRHPVDRAYSAYWHGIKWGKIPPGADFVSVLDQLEQLRGEGMYGQHLNRFLEHFPRANLLVLVFEEMMRDRRVALATCYEFLGVNPEFVPPTPDRRVNQTKDVAFLSRQLHLVRMRLKRMPPFVQVPLIPIGRRIFRLLPKQKSYVPLSESVRQELLDHFASDISLLEDTLGRDLSVWRRSQGQQVASHSHLESRA